MTSPLRGLRPGTTKSRLLTWIRSQPPEGCRLRQAQITLSLSEDSLDTALSALARRGFVKKVSRGVWRAVLAEELEPGPALPPPPPPPPRPELELELEEPEPAPPLETPSPVSSPPADHQPSANLPPNFANQDIYGALQTIARTELLPGDLRSRARRYLEILGQNATLNPRKLTRLLDEVVDLMTPPCCSKLEPSGSCSWLRQGAPFSVSNSPRCPHLPEGPKEEVLQTACLGYAPTRSDVEGLRAG